MSNLGDLASSAISGVMRLPVFERLAKGESPSLPSIYDMTTPKIRAEIKKVVKRVHDAHAKGKDSRELIKLLDALHEVLRSRGEPLEGSGRDPKMPNGCPARRPNKTADGTCVPG